LALEAASLGSPKGLDVIRRQTSQLTHLVNDLLDVARVTSGRIELRVRSLDLGEALSHTIDGLQERIESSGLTLKSEIEPGVVVDGDSARLEQVFGNLLTNAVKYTPAGGTIEVILKCENQHAFVTVKDSGVGLSAESLEQIFEQFVQVESTLARAQGGLGIGLTLARTLVKLHGGSLRARSDGEGQGSEFTVRLPLCDGLRQSRATPPGPEPSPTPGRSIVIVEDNDDLRELLVSLLIKKGHSVRSASNGDDGLKLLLDPETEAGVIDIGLPQLDGYEVAAQARKARGNDLRLVALTGYGQATDRVRALKAGFDEHLAKPPDIGRLLVALEAEN
jgi:CheY-like chemotaxis protein